MKKPLNVLLVLYLFFLAGCATVPLTAPRLDSEAKKFSPVPGKSVIYIFRDEIIGTAVFMTVFFDGKIIGQTAPQTYFALTVDPGKHQIMSQGISISVLDINTEAEKIYYVWQEMKMEFLGPGSLLQLTDKKRGQAGVKASKRAVPIAPFR